MLWNSIYSIKKQKLEICRCTVIICWLGLMATSILSYPRTILLPEAVRPKEGSGQTHQQCRFHLNNKMLSLWLHAGMTIAEKKLITRVMMMYIIFYCNVHNLPIPHQVTKKALWHFIVNIIILIIWSLTYKTEEPLFLTRLGFTLYICQNWLKILKKAKTICQIALTLYPANVNL